MVTEDQIRAALRTQWHLPPDECAPLSASERARTWLVSAGGERYVAKLVPEAGREQLQVSLAVAEHLDRIGFAVGGPVWSVDGMLAVPVPVGDTTGVLALLKYVPGHPLDGDSPVDQLWWGDLLGAVHRGLSGFSHPKLIRLRPLNPDLPHLSLEPWLRPAVAGATAGLVRLTVTDQLTYGVVHGDPRPGSFRIDPDTGRTGVVGWDSVAVGLLMFDVANAVAYAGGPDRAVELLDGYRSNGPLPAGEIEVALPVVLRCRWARRADRFARRIAESPGDAEQAWLGLHEARDALAALAEA
ncbi:MAG TPA: phosphotransferase [Rugosimonospora sp.]|nr:phosphotransferase [Rugosimonospora sp.]